MDAYKVFANNLGEQIINWARPEGWPVGATSVSDKYIYHDCGQSILLKNMKLMLVVAMAIY
jgi:hypothetical protein